MKCPSCFAWLPSAPSHALCTGTCPPADNVEAEAVRGYTVRTKPVFEVSQGLTSWACPTCSGQTTQEACGYCGYPVPANWREAKVTCVAMAGARATGKSLLLGVAKEQLDLWVSRHHRSKLKGIGDTERHFIRQYTEPLYEHRRLLEATTGLVDVESVTRNPMMFQFQERHPATGASRTRILVLRDVAGEDLEALGGADRGLTFFSRADGVIALVDPLTVSQIRAILADFIPPGARVGGDGTDVLQHVLGLMTDHAPGRRTQIPLAVTLSKVDVLQKLREVEGTKWSQIMNRSGSPLQRDPSMRNREFNTQDGDLLHEEVSGLLELLNAGQLRAMVDDVADRFRFFAVSALGDSPSGMFLHSNGIAPFRVIDPFIWILEETAR